MSVGRCVGASARTSQIGLPFSIALAAGWALPRSRQGRFPGWRGSTGGRHLEGLFWAAIYASSPRRWILISTRMRRRDAQCRKPNKTPVDIAQSHQIGLVSTWQRSKWRARDGANMPGGFNCSRKVGCHLPAQLPRRNPDGGPTVERSVDRRNLDLSALTSLSRGFRRTAKAKNQVFMRDIRLLDGALHSASGDRGQDVGDMRGR